MNLLDNLSSEQLSRAFLFLTNDAVEPPKELKHLTLDQWQMLEKLLNLLMLERQLHNLH